MLHLKGKCLLVEALSSGETIVKDVKATVWKVYVDFPSPIFDEMHDSIRDEFDYNTWKKTKVGDLVENIVDSGYRTRGVYMIRYNDKGDKDICPLTTEVDDYGHIGPQFSLGYRYPVGYWDVNFEKAYWHSCDPIEPVSVNVWGLIMKEDVREVVNSNAISYTEFDSYVDFPWGTLHFPHMKKKDVIYFLQKEKKNNTETLYFESNSIRHTTTLMNYEY